MNSFLRKEYLYRNIHKETSGIMGIGFHHHRWNFSQPLYCFFSIFLGGFSMTFPNLSCPLAFDLILCYFSHNFFCDYFTPFLIYLIIFHQSLQTLPENFSFLPEESSLKVSKFIVLFSLSLTSHSSPCIC